MFNMRTLSIRALRAMILVAGFTALTTTALITPTANAQGNNQRQTRVAVGLFTETCNHGVGAGYFWRVRNVTNWEAHQRNPNRSIHLSAGKYQAEMGIAQGRNIKIIGHTRFTIGSKGGSLGVGVCRNKYR